MDFLTPVITYNNSLNKKDTHACTRLYHNFFTCSYWSIFCVLRAMSFLQGKKALEKNFWKNLVRFVMQILSSSLTSPTKGLARPYSRVRPFSSEIYPLRRNLYKIVDMSPFRLRCRNIYDFLKINHQSIRLSVRQSIGQLITKTF